MRLEVMPRVRLAALPTPLNEVPRLAAALGIGRLFIKRDDLTGLAFGGNKTRKLEFVMADAVRQGAHTVVTSGAAQSNHARQTAAAARKLGLRCVLVLTRSVHNEAQGNLLLDHLLKADIHLVESAHAQTEAAEVLAADEQRKGRQAYVIPVGASTGIGAMGYVNCILELAQQLVERGIAASRLYVASGSGGTQGGLILGARLYHAPYQIVGISPGRTADEVRANVVRVANEGAERLDVNVRFTPDDVDVHDEYMGPGYAVPTDASTEAIRLFAENEGIILDPVYTAKAAAGMIDHIRGGVVNKDEALIFLHTGGTPALFAYQEELLTYLTQGRHVREKGNVC